VSQLLLYVRVLIPTYDFGLVPALVRCLGVSVLRDLMEKGSTRLLRRFGLLGYAGKRQCDHHVCHPPRSRPNFQMVVAGAANPRRRRVGRSANDLL
jgi:hypothetical protein